MVAALSFIRQAEKSGYLPISPGDEDCICAPGDRVGGPLALQPVGRGVLDRRISVKPIVSERGSGNCRTGVCVRRCCQAHGRWRARQFPVEATREGQETFNHPEASLL